MLDLNVAPAEERLRLAYSIAAPNSPAMLLTPDNRLGGYSRIEEAVRRGIPYFVNVRQDVLAIDDDHDRRAILDEISVELVREGESSVLVASGRADSHHLFSRVGDPRLKAGLTRRARTAGLDVRTTIRPPLTPHRLGPAFAPRLIEPGSAVDALARLERTSNDQRRRLSPRMAALLRYGDVANRYPSRSEADAAFCLGARNAGWAFDDVRRAFADRSNELGAKYRERLRRSPQAADAYLELTYGKAHAKWQRTSRFDEQLARIEAAVAAAEWPGGTGTSDLAAMLVLLSISARARTLTVSASVRRVAEAAGIGTDTASNALRRLQPRWVRRLTWGSGNLASEYRLADQEVCPGVRLDRARPEQFATVLAHDAFRGGGGLGKGCAHVFVLAARPRTARELSTLIGVDDTTIRRRLARLHEFGLVTATPSGLWVAVRSIDLDAVAEKLGTAGKGLRKKQGHEIEREMYRAMRRRSG